MSDLKQAEPNAEETCPTFALSADDAFGMEMMVKLTHWADEEHGQRSELALKLRSKMREFELYLR